MATIWITEFAAIGGDSAGKALPVFKEPALRTQKVAFSTAAQSATFDPRTTYVRFLADADCHVRFGSDPTADSDDEPFHADVEYGRSVRSGHKISAYDGVS